MAAWPHEAADGWGGLDEEPPGQIREHDVSRCHLDQSEVTDEPLDAGQTRIEGSTSLGGRQRVWVDVQRRDPGSTRGGGERQHSRPRAEVQYLASGQRLRREGAQTQPRGLMVAGAEAHRRLDDDAGHAGRHCRRQVPGGGDEEVPYANGCQAALRSRGPIFVRHFHGRAAKSRALPGQGRERQIPIDGRPEIHAPAQRGRWGRVGRGRGGIPYATGRHGQLDEVFDGSWLIVVEDKTDEVVVVTAAIGRLEQQCRPGSGVSQRCP